MCVVDILLLRPMMAASSVLQKGDIDGQIATIFDAPTKPMHLEQLKGIETPIGRRSAVLYLVGRRLFHNRRIR